MSKVQSLHGTTPAEIFQSGIENLSGIEAVAAAVLCKDGTVACGWANIDAANFALMVLALDQKQRNDNLRPQGL